MYHTCIFCYSDLGSNPLIEACPIGQRLAFDPKRGRLWVVCRRYERWNLTPIEERWEALEDCERRFRGTRLRYSTDNIGLARLAPGIDLVRIGSPLRPELAAWRYGDQFGRRRRRYMLIMGGASLAIVGAVYLTSSALAAVGVTGSVGTSITQLGIHAWRSKHTALTVTRHGKEPLPLSGSQLDGIRLLPDGAAGGWGISIEPRPSLFRREPLWITGEPAIEVLQRVLPAVNSGGGSRKVIQHAVTLLEHDLSPDQRLRQMAEDVDHSWGRRWITNINFRLGGKPPAQRLALEMLLREGLEERSMKGELWLLEREWKAAEQVAAIADDLLLPDGIRERIDAESRKQR